MRTCVKLMTFDFINLVLSCCFICLDPIGEGDVE